MGITSPLYRWRNRSGKVTCPSPYSYQGPNYSVPDSASHDLPRPLLPPRQKQTNKIQLSKASCAEVPLIDVWVCVFAWPNLPEQTTGIRARGVRAAKMPTRHALKLNGTPWEHRGEQGWAWLWQYERKPKESPREEEVAVDAFPRGEKR